MANKRITCRLGLWVDERNKKRRLKFHRCDQTCSMTQAECLEVTRTQGFTVPSWGHMSYDEWVETEPRRRIVSQLMPSQKAQAA